MPVFDDKSYGKPVEIEILDASQKNDMRTIWAYSLEFDEKLLLKKAA